jgi:hypothetical protein
MSNKKLYVFLSLLIVLTLALAGCGGAVAPAGPGGGDGSGGGSGDGSGGGGNNTGGGAGLKIAGMVDNEMNWSEDEVRAMDSMDVVSTNKDGEESTYTGVSINALLDEAGVQDGAATVVFVADDGQEAEASLDEVRGCSDCIVSFRNQGGFSIVMPGYPGSMQVKGVVEIKVQ